MGVAPVSPALDLDGSLRPVLLAELLFNPYIWIGGLDDANFAPRCILDHKGLSVLVLEVVLDDFFDREKDLYGGALPDLVVIRALKLRTSCEQGQLVNVTLSDGGRKP